MKFFKYEKIKFDKIWEYHNGGLPQMRMQKFTLLHVSARHITILRYTEKYERKIKLDKSLWHQNGVLQNSNFSIIQTRHMKLSK